MPHKENEIPKTQPPKWVPDKSLFRDTNGAYLTQSLFLEVGYKTDFAVYTFHDEDKEYKGKIFKSLRKLYLETEDPTEYVFANTYLYGWDHWQRIVNNAVLMEHIQKWREELEVRLRSKGVMSVLSQAGTNFTAAKWVTDGLWKRGASNGRKPNAAEKRREERISRRVTADTAGDIERVTNILRNKQEK
jgi:hypothetical protein